MEWAGLWLIYARKEIKIRDYAAVYAHLKKHRVRLEKKAGSNQWYELQASPSDQLDSRFAAEKLVWMDMSDRGRFAYSDDLMFCNDKGFILTGNSLKYLCAILNSSLVTWFMRNYALTTGVGLLQWKKFAVERLPIPSISTEKQKPFVSIVDEIMRLKARDPKANTISEEAKVDQLVYDLYGLSDRESAAVI